MKWSISLSLFAACILMVASCQDAAKTNDVKTPVTEAPKPDTAQARADIVAVETAWANALNKKDINALMALYADDAVSMPPGEPPITGKANIQKKEEADFMNPSTYKTIAFQTLNVYGQGSVVTEVGKTNFMDAQGKVTGTGKYISVFEKRDGKYLCIREIYSSDAR